jgi:hypothetical protein
MHLQEERRTRPTRRAVVATGVKLAYAAPLVAASFGLTGGALAAADCSCKPAGFVFDASPPLDQNSNLFGYAPACCSCTHCTDLGATAPYYDPASNQCLQGGQSLASICYPICADVCHAVSGP